MIRDDEQIRLFWLISGAGMLAEKPSAGRLYQDYAALLLCSVNLARVWREKHANYDFVERESQISRGISPGTSHAMTVASTVML